MSPRRNPSAPKSVNTTLCGKCGLTLEEAPLLDFREDVPVFAPDPDLDALLASTAADNAIMLDALAKEPPIELPLSIYKAELLRIREHVEHALDALPSTKPSARAREELSKALAAFDSLGAREA